MWDKMCAERHAHSQLELFMCRKRGESALYHTIPATEHASHWKRVRESLTQNLFSKNNGGDNKHT